LAGFCRPEWILVLQQSLEQKRVPLAKSLADPVFGGSIPEVTTNLVYHMEYAGQRTPDFEITVFEYPRPRTGGCRSYLSGVYTGQSPKRNENTTGALSAVEGSRLELTLQLNKPVRSAHIHHERERGAHSLPCAG
jgi:hypothetical protein